MPAFISRYCGLSRYLSNSAAHWVSFRGGTAPVTGRHSVMERPESVSRVRPPTTIIAITREEQGHQPQPDAAPGAAMAAVDAAALRDRRLRPLPHFLEDAALFHCHPALPFRRGD